MVEMYGTLMNDGNIMIRYEDHLLIFQLALGVHGGQHADVRRQKGELKLSRKKWKLKLSSTIVIQIPVFPVCEPDDEGADD